jgi:hypothetical protein
MPIEPSGPENPGALEQQVRAAVGARFGPLLTVSPAFRVESAEPGRFIASDGAGLVQPIERWQCLVGNESDPLAAVDVADHGGSYSVISIAEGPIVEALNAAAGEAASVAESGSYEFRTIEIAAFDFMAAHLVALDGGDEVFVPLFDLGEDGEGLRALERYSGFELRQALRAHHEREEGEGMGEPV